MLEIKAGSAKPEMFLLMSSKLMLVMYDLLCFFEDKGIYSHVITSMHRSGDAGVHGTMPCRGVDLSCRHIPQDTLDVAVKYINQKYVYDSKRPDKKTMIIHSTLTGAGDGGVHIHLQTLK